MSDRICYMVVATLPSEELASQYVAWLEDGHVDAVIRAGARSAMIARLDAAEAAPASTVQIMTQYIFSTRDDFDRYVRDAAPALRAEGLAKFGPERGVRMERRTGRVI